MIDNGISSSETGVLVSSGFGAKVMTDTTEKIFEIYKKARIKAYSFRKPGHEDENGDDVNDTFTFGSMANATRRCVNKMRTEHSRIILIGNSMTAGPMLHVGAEYKGKVVDTLLLSPALDPIDTIKRRLELMGVENPEVSESILNMIGDSEQVRIDAKIALQELRDLGPKGFQINREQRVCIVYNGGDKVVKTDGFENKRSNKVRVVRLDGIEGDTQCHSIDADLIKRDLLMHVS